MKTNRLLLAGLLGGLAFGLGCENRTGRDAQNIPTPTAEEAGQDVGEAARDAKEGAEKFLNGVKDGWGGTGDGKLERGDKVPEGY